MFFFVFQDCVIEMKINKNHIMELENFNATKKPRQIPIVVLRKPFNQTRCFSVDCLCKRFCLELFVFCPGMFALYHPEL